jgi:hypothetical protein
MKARNAIIVGCLFILVCTAGLAAAPVGSILAVVAGAGISIGMALLALVILMSRWHAEAARADHLAEAGRSATGASDGNDSGPEALAG